MKHLRRLNLSRNRSITKLRNSICKLQNLQTLLLDECEKLEELPKNMRYMISLRLLEITTKQKSLPESLNSLQFLSIVRCGNMEYLSEVKQGYMGLRMLVIGHCEGLISLFPFLKCLTLLEVLCIDNCEKLDLTKVEDNQEEFKPSIRGLEVEDNPMGSRPTCTTGVQREESPPICIMFLILSIVTFIILSPCLLTFLLRQLLVLEQIMRRNQEIVVDSPSFSSHAKPNKTNQVYV
ncbi:putative disease resistance rpp13-like protein 1 [Quercus suber]|uniref:Disease resistance rpp13-like protein 1 n=1 Tax=Quercus suber TaxID=58331 RepID=A0AAW0LPG2_QUESU